jgi:putative transposase
VIRDERDLGRHLDYIHFNPVKHGYAKRAIDWPFSTFARHVQDGIYPPDWGGTADVCDMDLE